MHFPCAPEKISSSIPVSPDNIYIVGKQTNKQKMSWVNSARNLPKLRSTFARIITLANFRCSILLASKRKKEKKKVLGEFCPKLAQITLKFCPNY